MTYLVIESNLSYALVMDENGNFLKVANLNYQVGQKVENVFEMQIPEIIEKKSTNPIKALAAFAAVLVMVLGLYFNPLNTPFATVTISINPQIEIQVNINDQITKIKALNDDGKSLIDQYNYKDKDLQVVTEELVRKAHALGFFDNTNMMNISYKSKKDSWTSMHAKQAKDSFAISLSDEFDISITIIDENIQKIEIVTPKPKLPDSIIPMPIPDEDQIVDPGSGSSQQDDKHDDDDDDDDDDDIDNDDDDDDDDLDDNDDDDLDDNDDDN